MNRKVLSYIGFARKSGNLVSGAGTCMLPAIRKKLKLILIAEDTADGSVEKISRMAAKDKTELRVYGSSEDISQSAGLSLRNIFGITDAGLADVIIKEIDSEKEV